MLTLSFATACVPSVTVVHHEPPRIVLQANQTKIVMISLFDSSNFVFNQDKKVEVFKTGYDVFVESILEPFNKTELFVRWEDREAMGLPAEVKSIPEEKIKTICAEQGVDMLLVLEDFQLTREKYVDVERNDDGSKSRTVEFTALIRAPVSLYSSDGKIMNRTRLFGEKLLASRSAFSGLLAVGPSMGNRGDEIIPLLQDVGWSYVENFKPHDVKSQESFYTKRELKPLRETVKNQEWEKARSFSQNVFDTTVDQKTKKQAGHNLYLVNLMLNNQEEAEKWRPYYPFRVKKTIFTGNP